MSIFDSVDMKAFSEVGNKFYLDSLAARAFAKHMIHAIKESEKQYIQVYGKLPGSNRTKRLRKKRFKAIINYCFYGKR